MESGSTQTEGIPERGIWMLPSSDEEDDENEEDTMLVSASTSSMDRRGRWWRRNLAVLEEYCVRLFIPAALCMFAVSALIADWYSTQTFVLPPNSSVLFEPSPWLVYAMQTQVIHGQVGPALHGFAATPILGSEASWHELHDIVVASDYTEAFVSWLNKGSSLNVTCLIKQTGSFNIVVRVLEEHKTTQAWMQDFGQLSELQCHQTTDEVLEYTIPRDGNYSIVVDNIDEQSVEIFLGVEVHAMLYSTDMSVYLCNPYPKACSLQISLFGSRVAVLSTPDDYQGKSWEATLTYKIRWFTLATALGCLFLIASMAFEIVSHLQSRASSERHHENRLEEQVELPDEDVVDALEDSEDHGFCAICVDARKDSFFIPCGHSATCLTCGLKLTSEGGGTCPICKEEIEVVKQMFLV